MDAAEMRRRLESARVAHLATVSADGSPHVVPLCFAVIGDAIVSVVDHKPKRTTALRRLDNVRANPAVALLVDAYDDLNWDRLWWVRVDGRAEVVESGPEHARAVVALTEKYAQYRDRPPRGVVIRIRIERWTGWASRADTR